MKFLVGNVFLTYFRPTGVGPGLAELPAPAPDRPEPALSETGTLLERVPPLPRRILRTGKKTKKTLKSKKNRQNRCHKAKKKIPIENLDYLLFVLCLFVQGQFRIFPHRILGGGPRPRCQTPLAPWEAPELWRLGRGVGGAWENSAIYSSKFRRRS